MGIVYYFGDQNLGIPRATASNKQVTPLCHRGSEPPWKMSLSDIGHPPMDPENLTTSHRSSSPWILKSPQPSPLEIKKIA